MDSELINMCYCEEIQGRWSPEVGDICSWDIKDPELGRTIAGGFGIIGQLSRGRKEAYVYHERGGATVAFKDAVYIPRIEDVLGWLGVSFESLKRIKQTTRLVGTTKGSVFHKSTGEHDDLKALLKAFVQPKEWDGKRWLTRRH